MNAIITVTLQRGLFSITKEALDILQAGVDDHVAFIEAGEIDNREIYIYKAPKGQVIRKIVGDTLIFKSRKAWDYIMRAELEGKERQKKFIIHKDKNRVDDDDGIIYYKLYQEPIKIS